MLESFRDHHRLSDKLNVWGRHCDWPKQLLQIIWQLRTPSVALARWVHGHEDTGILVDRDRPSEQGESRLLLLDGILDDLDLL